MGLRRGIVMLGLLGLTACGGRVATFNDLGAKTKTGDASPKLEAAEALWKERADHAKAQAAVKAWEEAAALDATRADVQLKLAYGYYFLANVHARWHADADAEMKALFLKGTEAGKRAIKLQSPAFAAKIDSGASWPEAVKAVGKDGVAGLYWYATNLGKWGLLDGITTILHYKDDIFAIMTHCRTLDPSFFYGAPDRYFGVYWAKIPFGKDLKKSGEHFKNALGLSSTYLDTKVLFAQYNAAYSDDEALFKKLLGEVIAAPDDLDPALAAENANAKRVAKDMLENIDDYL